MIINEHLRLLSLGPQLFIASLRQQYWIPKIKQLIHPVFYCCLLVSN